MDQPAEPQITKKALRPTVEKVMNERTRIARLGRIRQIVFGSLDGLLVPLGVVSGVAGGTGNSKAVIVAGLAEAFAGALSMGVGEFISGKAEAEVQRAEVRDELAEMQRNPGYEFNEMIVILESEGVQPDDARVIATRLQRNPEAYAKTMIEKELGLEIHPETVKIGESITMGFSYMIASIVPLVAYFFVPVQTAFFVSLGLSFLFLIGLGLLRGKLARTNMFWSAVEIVLIGSVSGLGGYILGTWLPQLLNL